MRMRVGRIALIMCLYEVVREAPRTEMGNWVCARLLDLVRCRTSVLRIGKFWTICTRITPLGRLSIPWRTVRTARFNNGHVDL
jgi:uncharacterized membrane protein YjgN (DUF898 family)